MALDFTMELEKGMECLHSKGAFLTARNDDKVNVMTISWGAVGFIWGKPVFQALVRKSRYTYDFIEKSNEFTISIPMNEQMKDALAICGTKSGRDVDKFKEAGMKTAASNKVEAPVIDGCNLYYECKVVFKQEMDLEKLDEELKNKFYGSNDIHTMYYGEIVDCYVK